MKNGDELKVTIATSDKERLEKQAEAQLRILEQKTIQYASGMRFSVTTLGRLVH